MKWGTGERISPVLNRRKKENVMKKAIVIPLMVLTVFLLVGCGNVTLETVSLDNPLTDTYTDAIPVESQLIVGTINLEGTDNAVDVDMAQQLLPLWQTLQSLENSDAAAAEEKNAVLEQIQETMAPAQIQAIRDMQLTQQSMLEVMQKQGMMMFGNRSGTSLTGTPSFQGDGFTGGGFAPDAGAGGTFSQDGGASPGGPPSDGAVPGGGFAGGNGQNLSQEQIATLRAGRTQNGGGRSSQGLINALIQFLEQKINPTVTPTPAAP
jgi:hypothetical protein